MLLCLLALSLSTCLSTYTYASGMNPCEYMNMNAQEANKLDVGNDPNFTRIQQQNNRDLIRACQEYEIKLLNEAKGDLNRDNY